MKVKTIKTQSLEQVELSEIRDQQKPILQIVVLNSAVGNSEFFPIKTLNQASAFYRRFCEVNGFGARDAGRCEIWDETKCVAHVSYNGKVWEGQFWDSNAKPIFVPSTPL